MSANKSLVGHAMAAAGALEAIATVLTLVHDLVPPTANLAEPDPEIGFDCVPNVARRARVECALSNSFGFGGQNLSLLFRRAAAPRSRMPAERGSGAPPAVVVTGIGSVSAAGRRRRASPGGRARATACRPIGPIRPFGRMAAASRLGGEAADLAGHLSDEEARRLARASQLAVVAARLALADAGLQPGQLAAAGLVLGLPLGGLPLVGGLRAGVPRAGSRSASRRSSSRTP